MKRIQVLMPTKQLEALDAYVQRKHEKGEFVTRSFVIREAVRQLLKEEAT